MSLGKIKGYCIVAAFTVMLYLGLSNFSRLSGIFSTLLGVLTPFLIALVIAFVLSGIMRFFEKKIFFRMADHPQIKLRKLTRPLSVTCTYLVMILALTLLFYVVTPQLGTSIQQLVQGVPGLVDYLNKVVNWLAQQLQLDPALWAQVESWLGTMVQNLLGFVPQLLGMLPEVYSLAMSLGGGVFTMIMGIMLSIYLLLDQERLLSQLARLNRAFLPQRGANWLAQTADIAANTFQKYVSGQLLDALIIGTVSVIGLQLLGFKNAMLVGVVMGVTNVIPFFGPIIGAVPGFFIILMDDPVRALWYILFVLVIQQIDGNVIAPKIVGGSVGLPPIWVLFSVMVGGDLFGVPGMVLGTPVFAVLYQLVGRATRTREAALQPVLPDEPFPAADE